MEDNKYLELNPKANNPEARTFVIGDIHGVFDQLNSLIDYIFNELKFTDNDYLIFVGDYIDRGYQSFQVVDFLIDLNSKYSNVFFLKGNHEDMLLDYLGFGGSFGDNFIRNGGDQTLLSYKLYAESSVEEILETMPKEHLDFYKNLHRMIVLPEHIICHAGVNSFRELEEQEDVDLFWIRDDFINNSHAFEKTVVFGHTPFKNIFNDFPFKVGVDTGLVYGNILSAYELSSNTFYQIAANSKEVTKANLTDFKMK